MKIQIGESIEGPLHMDLAVLLRTRALVQSVSGGGKSYLLRRLMELTFNHVQQLVVDPEGELVTLQGGFGYLVCSPSGGDIELSVERAAEIVSTCYRRRVSVLFDLSELTLDDRREFMVGFADGLINQPAEHWHHCLVPVDEADQFAPQGGKRPDSHYAVVDLSARGRKRGLCPILATQRLSKLHKDAASELLNKFIGMTSLDVDVKRAAHELGMNGRRAKDLLGRLEPGNFFCHGPALQPVPTRFLVGGVKTVHGRKQDLAALPLVVEQASRADVAKEIHAQVEAEIEAAGGGEPEDQEDPSDSRGWMPSDQELEREQEADRRLRLITPVLAKKVGERGPAVAKAAKSGNVSKQTIRNWVLSYEATYELDSLKPKKPGPQKAAEKPLHPRVEKIVRKAISQVRGTRVKTPARRAYKTIVQECDKQGLDAPKFAVVDHRYQAVVGAAAGAGGA